MIRKVYTSFEEFLNQNRELGTALPFSQDTGVLKTPFSVGTKVIPNRLVCQAMEGCDGTPTGEPDELTIRRYDRFAKGGAGLIWFEATAVLEEGRAMLADSDMGAELSTVLQAIMESVAYDAVAYAVKLPQLIAAIRAVNEDATIVIVGQYNPMKGVSLQLGEATVDVSEYLGYVVDGVAIHGIAYAAVTGEAIFVNASEVETKNTDMEWSIGDLTRMLARGFENLTPSTAGDAYIAGKIMDALTVKIAEDPEILKGDVDDDSKVNLRDAILVLKSVNGGAEVDAANADMDGNGKVTLRDAILILQLANGKVIA